MYQYRKVCRNRPPLSVQSSWTDNHIRWLRHSKFQRLTLSPSSRFWHGCHLAKIMLNCFTMKVLRHTRISLLNFKY